MRSSPNLKEAAWITACLIVAKEKDCEANKSRDEAAVAVLVLGVPDASSSAGLYMVTVSRAEGISAAASIPLFIPNEP